ncbi:MAG: 3-dehydroquinate synthase [Alistipes sp.]|jgi:3-dehydroquinate synthase|nr:3-dehydroquinate synthase [Alistipes sp.]
MVETIEIKRDRRGPCRIVVGDASATLPELLPADRRVVAITDSNVNALYGSVMGGFADRVIVIPGGEENKNLATIETIHRRLVEIGADRKTFLVGLGGGVVTDIAGFAASTYMRGLDFGFVATSLMAQVDASVGGKNGVNVGGFKNMAGTFAQPDFVVCDTATLLSLPPREFRAGLAEVIKAGIVGDPVLLEIMETHSPGELLVDGALLTETIVRAIAVKACIVEADERETGPRRKLNLGHTVGHAVEKLSREPNRSTLGQNLNHGEAVAIGLATIADVAVKMGALDPQTRDRIVRAIEKAGLPTRTEIPAKDIIAAVTRDKKMDGGALWLVVPRAVGDVVVRRALPDELAAWLSE